ncbi:Mss4-like [Penicillium roqueforti FM164]|uniref:Mss4-like n=1 Tax=Penicillium roqueforti (strain FM164) TaxID=1365484 RepID=W6Q4P5_PENRF|nr:Mss4-like [Penicillium roqueforti FM164]
MTTTPIACICGSVSLSIQLDSLTDHSKLQLCHCNRCRLVTGQLSSSYYLLQHEPPNLDGLQEYQQSDHVSHFFCKTCGAHVFARMHPGGQFLVASGLLAKNVPLVRAVEHWQSSDTGDGGLSALLPRTESPVTGCRLHISTNIESPNRESTNPAEYISTSQHLRARCLCGGVEFYITKPDASSLQASSPWPDLLVPYYTGSGANPGDIKWWLRSGGTKYIAGACVCTSCRLSSGFPIQTWAFVPKSNIFNADGSPLMFNVGTMQRHRSSSGVYREFCSRCGATAFWHCDERPLLIDVSVGLLQAHGARAEDWLEWVTNRISFAEMAVQHDLIHILEDGLEIHSKQK